MERPAFDDLLAEEFNLTYHGRLTVDEMLLHPRTALRFCADVRQKMASSICPMTSSCGRS